MQVVKSMSWGMATATLIGSVYWWLSATQSQPSGGVQLAVPAPAPSPGVTPPIASNGNPAKFETPQQSAIALSSPAQPNVGSEGYGSHIDRASSSGDAILAWQAVKWLHSCIVNETQTQALQLARDNGVAHAAMTQAIQDSQLVGRRCQTVTARHQALLPELSLRAMRSEIIGAAAAYAASGKFEELSAPLQVEVLAAIRRDAAVGDSLTLTNATTSGGRWGLTDAERLTYLAAYIGLSDSPEAMMPMAKALLEQSDIKPIGLSGEQISALKAAAQRIIISVKSRPAPG